MKNFLKPDEEKPTKLGHVKPGDVVVLASPREDQCPYIVVRRNTHYRGQMRVLVSLLDGSFVERTEETEVAVYPDACFSLTDPLPRAQ